MANRCMEVEKRETDNISSAILVRTQAGVAIEENSLEFPQKIKNGIILSPSDSTSGNISEGTQNTNFKEYMHPYVHCSIIYNS